MVHNVKIEKVNNISLKDVDVFPNLKNPRYLLI